MENKNNFKKGGYLISLSGPIFVELLLQMLVGNVDQLMVGRYSQNGVGAIGNANQIINLIILVFSVISISTTILVSLYKGSGDNKKAEIIYTLSIFVNTIISFVITIVLIFFGENIFIAMDVPEDVLTEAVVYIRIIGAFIIFQGLYLTFTAIFRSNALMKESMIVSIIINIINIIGNALLIPHIGIAGAAVSSDISRAIGLLVMIYIFKKKVDGKISLEHLKPFPTTQLKKLLGIGLPSGGESLSYNGSQIVIQSMSNKFGTGVIITKAYCTMFAMVSYLYTNAISQASQIVIGYLVGAKDIENVEKQVHRTLIISLAVSAAVAILIYIFSGSIFGFFTDDIDVIELGKTIMFIDIFLELGRAVNMVMVRDLQAVGDITFPIVIGIICMWIFSVALGYFLGFTMNLGLIGFWISMSCDECIRAIIFIIRWRSGKWRGHSIID